MIDELSFCILNTSPTSDDLGRCIESIRAQGVDDREILVGGQAADVDGIRQVGDTDWLQAGRIGAIRNELCRAAVKRHVVLIDSAVELAPDWYGNIRDVEYYDCFGSAVTTHGGDRAVDWAYLERIAGQAFPRPADYDEWSPRIFPGPWLVVLRREVCQRVAFDETQSFASDEHADFCRRLVDTGYRHGIIPAARATLYPDPKRAGQRPLATFADVNGYLAPYDQARSRARAAIKAHRFRRGEQWLTEANRAVPGEESVCIDLAILHRITGRCAEAVDVLNGALETSPDNPALLCARGMAHWQMLDLSSAESDFDRALAGAPDTGPLRLEALRGLGWTRLPAGRPQEAAECFQAVIDRAEPVDRAALLNAHHGMTWCHCATGRFEQARASFLKAAENWDVNDILQKKSLRKARSLTGEGVSDIAAPLSCVLAPDLYVHRRGASLPRKVVSRIKGRLFRMLRRD